jgi:membrane protein
VVGIGFLLLVSLAMSAWLIVVGTYFGQLLPAPAAALEVLNFVISLGVITVLFAMTFKLLPDVTIAWRDVWPGAALTSLLFTAGKFVIGLYLGKSAVASAYGAAGTSSSSWSGSTTRRRSCCLVPSSPRGGRSGGVRGSCWTRRRVR